MSLTFAPASSCAPGAAMSNSSTSRRQTFGISMGSRRGGLGRKAGGRGVEVVRRGGRARVGAVRPVNRE